MNNKLWQSLANAWKIPDLRTKLLFTAAMVAIYRFGCFVPVPGIDLKALEDFFAQGGAGVIGFLDLFSGGALRRVAVFALGIMPYITASIIMQLLTVVIPKLEELAKEGEQGQKQITKYTRWLTVGLSFVQSLGYIVLFRQLNALPDLTWWRAALIVSSLVTGAVVVMWLGELITARGIGNGMSIMIFISIVSRIPSGAQQLFSMDMLPIVLFMVIGMAVIVGVIWITSGERRIPVQYAKRVVGRRMMGGQSTFIPLKVNMAGVIPVIFASSVMMIVPTFTQFLGTDGIGGWFERMFGPSTLLYIIGEAILIVIFTYFYTAVTFNPVDQADNLKKYGGFIPGVRPGRPTAEYLDRILTRLTFPGALFLASLAVLPWLLSRPPINVPFYFGGTSLLIVVGVALDTMRQMEAQLLMRHYEGFLK
ncbi:MAG TPA: preprotein translocase subunit SecY [Thermoleophilia bacterium]|nr:preprotein translocase subunit SecY [Acidobacteriota bacterium]HOU29467.1 preprotein translocase subunit SecY [Thermoleophilia bacterium]HQH21130.1 preprotein translocase subunit SecY [Thermoleophilia bacterium]HQJ25621.1 preprotein translocase subunit SecY [Thermoleophilia bacterium]